MKIMKRRDERLHVQKRLAHAHEHDLAALDVLWVNGAVREQVLHLGHDFIAGQRAHECVTSAAEAAANRASALSAAADHGALFVGRVLVEHRLGHRIVEVEHVFAHVRIGGINSLHIHALLLLPRITCRAAWQLLGVVIGVAPAGRPSGSPPSPRGGTAGGGATSAAGPGLIGEIQSRRPRNF